jgi:trans-aconitate methyltransferase
MIEKAKRLDKKNNYFCSDLLDWTPKEKVDIVHSMEVFYYFKNPEILVNHIYNNWLNEGGRLIMGIDHYKENKPSNNWKEETSISIMQLFSENTWLDFFKTAGFVNIESWCYGKKDEWNGTLIVTGVK